MDQNHCFQLYDLIKEQILTMLSSIAADHVANPRNVGPMEGATHVGRVGTPGEGPYLLLYFLIADGTIKRAAYRCNQCPSTIACASMAAQILTGRTVAQALLLTGNDIKLLLGGLPEGKDECAERAAMAVQKALGEK